MLNGESKKVEERLRVSGGEEFPPSFQNQNEPDNTSSLKFREKNDVRVRMRRVEPRGGLPHLPGQG
jgi:hypothetical protein